MNISKGIPAERIAENNMNVDVKVESTSEYVKTVRTEKSDFTINLDRSRGLWSIGVSTGTVPNALKGEYTSPGAASVAIKNYVDGHAARSLIYGKKKES